MQILSGIRLPLSDEHVLSTDPVLAPELPNVWLRRMNAFAGRSVSADALTAEQEARAGRIRLRGQSVTAGVVRGLGTTLEAGAAGGGAMIQVAPGFGLARSGEDISVATPRRLKLADLPVYARADWLDAVAAGAPAPTPAPPPPVDRGSGGAFADLAAALPRRMANAFSTLIGSTVDPLLPRVAILVAEPVTAELVGRNDPADPCPRDPRDDPYDDWRRIDGCRLSLYLWPSEIVALPGTSAPDYGLPPAGPAMRNQLAWRIFQVESGMLPDEMHPWEELGVPLAMLAFDAALFVDRSAVVRHGGLPRPRTSPLPRGGTPVLWQAQLLQFVEQLADAGLGAVGADNLAQIVRELPPVGVLPASVFDPQSRVQKLFPGGYAVSAVPIAAEQIELALRQSVSLAPLNLNVSDSVELLVPVPERVYEPGLLRTEAVDPLFGYTVARFVSDRTMWLVHREMVRRRRDVLTGALSGMLPSWRAADPDETATERLATPADRPPVSAARFRRVVAKTDLRAQRFAGADVRLPVSAGDELFVWVRIMPGAAAPIGLSLGVAPHVASAGPDFGRAVYWGKRTALPQFATDTPAELRLAGPLPPKGTWTRLSAPAAAIWASDGTGLTGLTLDGVAFTQAGGSVEWGPFGKRDRAGNETVWIADEAPAGASLQAGADAAAIQWVDADPADEIPVEDDFGTARIDDSRVSGALEDFRGRWTMPFRLSMDLQSGPSRDGSMWALGDSTRVFAVRMDPLPGLTGPAFDFFHNCGLPNCTASHVSISPSGHYVLIHYGGDHTRILDVNPNTLALTPHVYPPSTPECLGHDPARGYVFDVGHADLTVDAQGNDIIVAQNRDWCSQRLGTVTLGQIYSVRFSDGAVTSLLAPGTAQSYHISCRNYSRPGWCYASFWPAPGKPFGDEIVALTVDGSMRVERLTHTHTDTTNCYPCEADPVPSPDGRRVIFASSWTLDCDRGCGSQSAPQAYVISLPLPKVSPSPS